MTGTARGSPHACFSPEGTDREGSLYLETLDSVLALSLGDVYNSDPTDENTKHTHGKGPRSRRAAGTGGRGAVVFSLSGPQGTGRLTVFAALRVPANDPGSAMGDFSVGRCE